MAIAEVGSGSQRATFRYSVAVSGTASFPGNITAGNLLTMQYGGWAAAGGSTAIIVTDTQSTPYATTLLSTGGIVWAGGSGTNAIGHGIAASSGACTVTIDPDAAVNYFNAVIDEFSGVDTSTPLDVDGGSSQSTSTTPSDTLTTTTANALVLGTMIWGDAGTTVTPGSGYTELDEDETAVRQPYAAEFKIAGAAGSQTVDWTLGVSHQWSVYTAAFKEGAVAAGQPLLARMQHLPHLSTVRPLHGRG